MIKILVILMVEGVGSSSSQPLPLAVYKDMATCTMAMEYAKKNVVGSMWTDFGCVPVVMNDGFSSTPLVH